MLIDFTKFGTAYPRECLAGWTADNDIKCVFGRAQVQVSDQVRRRSGYVTGAGMTVGGVVKVETVGTGRVDILLDGAGDVKAGTMKTQGETAASREEV